MSGVNEKERKTQERILHEIFEKRLEYTYLGNYEDRENNSNIEEDLLLKFLTKKYSEDISKKAIAELNNKKIDDVIEKANQKRLNRGGFEKRIFLEKTYK